MKIKRYILFAVVLIVTFMSAVSNTWGAVPGDDNVQVMDYYVEDRTLGENQSTDFTVIFADVSSEGISKIYIVVDTLASSLQCRHHHPVRE